MATLLSIIQAAAVECNLPSPSVAYTSSDTDIKRLVVLSNREGEELADAGPWTELRRLHTFTTSNGTQEYALPSDFAYLLRDTGWDRTNYRPLEGPTSAVEWQEIESGLIGSAVACTRFRIMRASSGTSRKIYLDPTPGATTQNIAFEYQSNAWCASSGGTLQTAWAADTDVPILPAELIIRGTVVRYLRAQGLEYGSQLMDYTEAVERALGRNRPAPRVRVARRYRSQFIGPRNIPDTGYGS